MPNPIVATKRPIATNYIASPAANAAGPNRCSLTAVPSTIGRSGNTHGDNNDKTPAINAKIKLLVAMMPLTYFSVDCSNASIAACFVSPAERPVSLAPLKAIRVLCVRAPNMRSASVCVSKSTS